MSLWWRSRVRIVVAPDAVRCVAIGRGAREGRVDSFPVIQSDVATPDPHATVIDALRQAVESVGLRKADAEVLLSSQFVRYLLLPWSADLATDDERAAYARLEFESIHGERARDWEIVIDDQPAGAAGLACAIDGTLLREVRAALTTAQMRVVSIAPQFVASFNRYRGKFSGKQCGFAFVEPTRITIAWLNRGAWQAVASPRSMHGAGTVIAAELQQARTLGHVGEDMGGRIYVAFADSREVLPTSTGGWEVVSLGDADPIAARELVTRPLSATES